MENKRKKSRAIIITIIILIIIILAGYLIFKKRDSFGVKTSATIAKIFSPLTPSENSDDLTVIEVQAGEDLKKGDGVSIFGTGTDNNPIVVRTDTNDGSIYGYANQDIKSGYTGKIVIPKNRKPNNFWDSISDFIGNITNKNNKCSNNATNYPQCTVGGDGKCLNGATNPTLCTTLPNDTCFNNAANYPQCTVGGDGKCIDGISTNPPACNNNGNINNFPTVNVTTSSSSVDSGGSATISWTSTNTDSCNAGTGKGTGTSGSFSTGPLTTSKMFSVTCTGANGNGSGSTFVAVNGGGNDNNFPTVNVTTSSSSVDSGGSATISWTSTNTDSCNAGTGKGTGTSGSFSTGPLTTSKMFSVTCTGANGNGSGSTFVAVNGGGYKTQCSDEIDNDKDGFTDIADPNCHVDGDPKKPYVPTHDSETSNPLPKGDKPDLTATKVSLSSTLVNTPIVLSSLITNKGKTTSATNFQSYFSIESLKNPSAPEIKTVDTPILPAGITGVIVVNYTFTTIGDYSIRVCADKKNKDDAGIVDELNEENNCSSTKTITISDPLPPISKTQCNDGIDNDLDGLIDMEDPGCENEVDDDETNNFITIYGCSDKIDNDNDGLIDKADPDCSLNGVYDETRKEIGDGSKENKCKILEDNPLTFTAAEKAKLAQLLRKYYLISPTLKSETDIDLIYKDMDELETQMAVITDITRQCYLLTNNSGGYNNFKSRNSKLDLPTFEESTSTEPNYSYTGPKTIGGNPWFKSESRVSYLDSGSLSVGKITSEKPYCGGTYNPEPVTSALGLKWWQVVASIFNPIYGLSNLINYFDIKYTPTSCFELNAQSRMKCEYMSKEENLWKTGCTWMGLSGVNDWNGINDDYERILNVW